VKEQPKITQIKMQKRLYGGRVEGGSVTTPSQEPSAAGCVSLQAEVLLIWSFAAHFPLCIRN